MACSLQYVSQSQNNNKRPNKKNDVITDLGGEGDFPMFLYDAPVFSASLKSTSDSASYRIPHRARHSLCHERSRYEISGTESARERTQRCSPVHRIGPTITEHRAAVFESSDFSSGAVHVVERLQDRGFEAYVVGGAVRDLLLGKKPKDFDVATNATPEQIKQCFRSARIIGRRFQIVHVRSGGKLSR